MAAPSFIDSGYVLFSFSGLLNLKCCQQPFTYVLFCSKVGIIKNEILFFGFYRCVNSGKIKFHSYIEACIGVLGIQDICHFTSRDIGYYPFYFQGYGILCSIFWLLSGILTI